VIRGDSDDVDHRETPIVSPYTAVAHDGREEQEEESVFHSGPDNIPGQDRKSLINMVRMM